ncbi:MAG: FeoB-associated Cys-rich membrane protein [Clostridiales bacterium]|nr:FeoB-associated Cys-rich membrane protein [Clostridiales bacterium]
MLHFVAENLATLVIGLLLLAVVVSAVLSLLRRRRRGGCSGCPLSSACCRGKGEKEAAPWEP